MNFSTLWPRHILAGPRTRLARVYRAFLSLREKIRNRIAFPIWRVISKSRYGEARIVVAHGHELWVRTDDLRGYWLWRDRGSQADLIATWKTLVDLHPEMAIDVGANYGEFSVVAANRLRVIAIEANPLVCDQLRRSLAHRDNVQVINAAASNRSGETSLYIPSSYTGGASLSEHVVDSIGTGHLPRTKRVSRVKTRVVTVDELVQDVAPQSLIVKIDVEGFDREVFEGALGSLRRARWWRAIVEFNADTLKHRGASVDDTWAYFAGYPGAIIRAGVSPVHLEDARLPSAPLRRANLLIGEGRP